MEEVTTQAPAALAGGAAPLPRLVTVQISHFCEKARWVLEHAGIAYDEEVHLQGPNVIAAIRSGGTRRVPVLVTPDGTVHSSSDAIARWCDGQRAPDDPERLLPDGPLGDRALALEDDLGRRLGPAARLWAYGALRPLHPRYDKYWAGNLSPSERTALKLGRRGIDLAVRTRFRVTPRSTDAALRETEVVFDEIAALLEQSGGPYLFGDQLTIADVSFAALGGPLVLPPQSTRTWPPFAALPPAPRATVLRMREHPAGAYALRLWAERSAR